MRAEAERVDRLAGKGGLSRYVEAAEDCSWVNGDSVSSRPSVTTGSGSEVESEMEGVVSGPPEGMARGRGAWRSEERSKDEGGIKPRDEKQSPD